MRLALVALLVSFATVPHAAAERSPRWGGDAQPRDGYLHLGIAWGGTGGAIGVVPDRCPGCDVGTFGAAMRFAFGYMVRDDLAPILNVAFGLRALDDPADGFSSQIETLATLGLRYWLGARPWIEASAGAAAFRYRAPSPATGTELGWAGGAAALAAGYELAAWETFAIVLVADARASFGDGERALTGTLSIGFDWWYLRFPR